MMHGMLWKLEENVAEWKPFDGAGQTSGQLSFSAIFTVPDLFSLCYFVLLIILVYRTALGSIGMVKHGLLLQSVGHFKMFPQINIDNNKRLRFVRQTSYQATNINQSSAGCSSSTAECDTHLCLI